eukprot:827915-Karenia_brevis.AAC.1
MHVLMAVLPSMLQPHETRQHPGIILVSSTRHCGRISADSDCAWGRMLGMFRFDFEVYHPVQP